MDLVFLLGTDRAHFVNRLADDVDDAAEGLGADRGADLLAHVGYHLAALEAVGGVHGDSTDRVFAQVLCYFKHQVVLTLVDGRIGDPECVVNRRELPGLEFDVDNGADDLRNFTSVLTHGTVSSCGRAASL